MKLTLDKTQMKYLAIMFMVLDHFAEIVLYQELYRGGILLDRFHLSYQLAALMYRIFKALGSFTGAVMIYFMVEGYHYTKSFKHYLLRFLAFGVITQPVFLYAFSFRYMIFNMMFALSLCLLTVYVHYHVINRSHRTILYILLFLANAYTDWTSLAVPTTLLLLTAFQPLEGQRGFKLDEKNLKIAWFLSIVYYIGVFYVYTKSFARSFESAEGLILAVVFLLNFYDRNKKTGRPLTPIQKKINQYSLYAIYPLHLLVIALTYNIIIKFVNSM